MMERSRFVTALLLAAVAATSVHAFTWPSFSRPGTIEEAFVEPAVPTTAEPVILHMAAQGDLIFDRVEMRAFFTTFIIKVYWDELPVAIPGPGPTFHAESLGTLEKGRYRILLQSYCGGRLAGSRQIAFEVKEAPGPGASTLDEVSVTPAAPIKGGAAIVHVKGHWPTAGYSRTIALTQYSSRNVMINLHWNSPRGPVAQVVTPYTYDTPIRLGSAGTYTVYVFVHLDGRQVDSAQMTFEVADNGGTGWPVTIGN